MKIFSESVENFGVRVIYLFNTINSFSLISGSFALVCMWLLGYEFSPWLAVVGVLFGFAISKIADWHPFFFPFLVLFFAGMVSYGFISNIEIFKILMFVVAAYLFVLLIINGGPQAIVGRDISIPFRMLSLCMFSIVPTTLSMPTSVLFGLFSGVMGYSLSSYENLYNPLVFLIFLVICFFGALVVQYFLPSNVPPVQYRPESRISRPFSRVVILNIDGARWDLVKQLKLPMLEYMISKGTHIESGLLTVYRALTNPAFGTILTGAPPSDHGIRDNNLGQKLAVEGLGDLIPTTIYGCMHMKHFAKEGWRTKIVSLPEHGIKKSDQIALNWLIDDLHNDHETRLFVFDFSEADFCGHSYGGLSKEYRDALFKIDDKIRSVVDAINGLQDADDICVVVCSDHGMHNLDHGYRLFRGESYVPCVFYGARVQVGHVIKGKGMINDICMTVAWLLDIPFPAKAQGQVFDVLKD